MYANTTGYDNTSVGQSSLKANTTGTFNTGGRVAHVYKHNWTTEYCIWSRCII